MLLASPHDECFAYFEKNIDSLRTALQDLDEYITTNGPFDAILGFSQGASLAVSYLAKQALAPLSHPERQMKCAIFICATNGVHVAGSRALNAEDDGEVIQIPTVHIVGSNDSVVEESLGVSRICDRRSRVVWDHKGGHEVPRRTSIVAEMASCIRETLDKAILLQ